MRLVGVIVVMMAVAGSAESGPRKRPTCSALRKQEIAIAARQASLDARAAKLDQAELAELAELQRMTGIIVDSLIPVAADPVIVAPGPKQLVCRDPVSHQADLKSRERDLDNRQATLNRREALLRKQRMERKQQFICKLP